MQGPRFSDKIGKLKLRLGWLFAVAVACIVAGAAAYHSNYRKAIRQDAADLLSSVLRAKTDQIVFWRADRVNDTTSLLDTPVLSVYLNRLAAAPDDKELRASMRERLQRYLKHNRYKGASLVKPDGAILVSAGEVGARLPPETLHLIKRAAASGRTELGDFYLDSQGRPRIDIAARAAESGGKRLYLVLEISPEDYLYPLIRQWPTNSLTAETTLSRRDGEDVVSLAPLRHAADAPLQLRRPFSDKTLPAGRALRGESGVFLSADYRGKKVLAAVGMVPDSGWALVAKMDWDEVSAKAGRFSLLMLLLTLAMAAVAAALAFLVFRLQSAAYESDLQEVESEKERYKFSYETLSDKANDMILLSDPEKRSLLMVNHKTCETYGYTEEEMLRLRPEDMIPPEQLQAFYGRFRALKDGASMTYETEHMKKGGERFPIEVSATGIRQGGRDLVHFICRDITERKRLEHELKEKERRLAGVMYNLPGMAYRCANAPGWAMEFVSNGCEQLTGYKPAELQGKNAVPYNDLIVPGDRDRVWREVQSAVGSGQAYRMIYRIRRKDGSPRTVWEQGNAIRDQRGRVEALEGLIIDNSEKTAAEEALKESEERYHQLFNSMEEGFAIHELIRGKDGAPEDYRWLEVNPAFERLTGLKSKSILGRRAREVLPKLEPLWLERFGRVALSGTPDHFESYAAELGRWYDVRAFSPKPGQFAVTFMDVTERRLASERLTASVNDWRNTFNAMDDVIWVLDRDNRILHANAATERVLGKKPGDIKGRRCWEIVHGTESPVEGCPVMRAKLSRRREKMDYVLGDRHYDVVVDPILGAGGEYAGAVHVLRDVTDSRRSALRLAELNRDLSNSLRLYTVLAQINQAAAQIRDRDRLYAKLCETAVGAGGFLMAWVGQPDRDTGRVLPLCSEGAGAEEYLDSVRISFNDGPTSKGPTGAAARTGRVAFCADIGTDPAMEPWRAKALKLGYRSSAAIPLQEGDKTVAVLSLYSSEKGFFSPDEVGLLGEIKADISLALEAISAEKKRAAAEAALERTAAHLTHALEAIPVVLFRLKISGGKLLPLWVSGSPKDVTGHDPEDLLNPAWFEAALHPEDKARVLREVMAIPRRGNLRHSFRLRRKDGTYMEVNSSLRYSPDAADELNGAWIAVNPFC